jgi:hypothetical protein
MKFHLCITSSRSLTALTIGSSQILHLPSQTLPLKSSGGISTPRTGWRDDRPSILSPDGGRHPYVGASGAPVSCKSYSIDSRVQHLSIIVCTHQIYSVWL